LSTIELNQPNEIEKTNNILVGDELSINEGTYSAFQLKKSINVFHDSILLLVQDQNRAIIKEGLNLNNKSYDGHDGTPVSWEIANFYRMPLIYVFNELTSIQYEIKNAEYQVLTDIINSSNKEVNTALYSRLITMNAKYDAIKKQEQITRLQSENDKRIEMLNNKDVELNDSQQVITNFVFVTLIFVVLLFFIIRSNYLRLQSNKKLKEQKLIIENQKLEVEDKNREILDSIEYAKRIQNTILPPQKIVSQYLENSFILYLPKDIVAGDFYWFAPPQPSSPTQPPQRGRADELNTNNDFLLTSPASSPPSGELDGPVDLGGAILFAACDCTGHGVPGAMVSVVCSNALNKAVNEFGLKDPSKILDKVAELVIDDLSKNNEVGDEIQDGMDASLANLNLTTLQLEWAGANNPLWIVRGTEIIEIKANKQPIGKTDYLEPFTNHHIQLQKGDTIYLFTDGYADQFGGEKGKKLSKNKFKELLISIQNKSMKEQREALYESHITWRGANEQVDDICVIGVRV
jgi:serine phosphatase RsbU (regulator of sigma subunit)